MSCLRFVKGSGFGRQVYSAEHEGGLAEPDGAHTKNVVVEVSLREAPETLLDLGERGVVGPDIHPYLAQGDVEGDPCGSATHRASNCK